MLSVGYVAGLIVFYGELEMFMKRVRSPGLDFIIIQSRLSLIQNMSCKIKHLLLFFRQIYQ